MKDLRFKLTTVIKYQLNNTRNRFQGIISLLLCNCRKTSCRHKLVKSPKKEWSPIVTQLEYQLDNHLSTKACRLEVVASLRKKDNLGFP